MVVTAPVFEMRGGAQLEELEPSDLSWEVQSNTPETVTATFELEGTVDMRNRLTELKHCLAVDVGGRLYGGQIMPHSFEDDAGRLKVTVRGIGVLFDHRSVLPLAALTQPLAPGGIPDPTLDTVVSGVDHGTIMKRVVQQACTWPGWTDIPITFQPDRAGTRSERYVAVEREKVADALSKLAGQEKGPDYRFQLMRTSADSFGWSFETGTEAQPRLQSPSVHVWEPAQGSGLAVSTNPSRMGSLAWSQGGRSNDTTIVEMLYDPTLVDAGYPLLELESDASVNTVDPATLARWNRETLRTGARPWEFWSFKVRADQSPFPYEYAPGDLCDVYVTKNTPVSGGYVPARQEPYRRRIVGLSGGLDEWVTITCGEVYDL